MGKWAMYRRRGAGPTVVPFSGPPEIFAQTGGSPELAFFLANGAGGAEWWGQMGRPLQAVSLMRLVQVDFWLRRTTAVSGNLAPQIRLSSAGVPGALLVEGPEVAGSSVPLSAGWVSFVLPPTTLAGLVPVHAGFRTDPGFNGGVEWYSAAQTGSPVGYTSLDGSAWTGFGSTRNWMVRLWGIAP